MCVTKPGLNRSAKVGSQCFGGSSGFSPRNAITDEAEDDEDGSHNRANHSLSPSFSTPPPPASSASADRHEVVLSDNKACFDVAVFRFCCGVFYISQLAAVLTPISRRRARVATAAGEWGGGAGGGCLSLSAAYYPVVCQPSVATDLSEHTHTHTAAAASVCDWLKCNWSHAGWRLVMCFKFATTQAAFSFSVRVPVI